MIKAVELFELPPNATHDEGADYIRGEYERMLRRHAAGQITLTDAQLDYYRDLAARALRMIEQDRHGAANLELPQEEGDPT